MIDYDKRALSEIVVFNKYAKFIPELGRRETFEEIVDRNMWMHMEKYPYMAKEISSVYEKFVKTKKVLPSMRSLQFGGRPILMAENRIFNCFSPETKVQTKELGLVALQDIVDTQVHVLNAQGEWVLGECKYFGKGTVRTAEFRNSKQKVQVKVTDNHRWWTTKDTRLTTVELKSSTKSQKATAIPYVTASASLEYIPEAFVHGLMYADGTVNKQAAGNYYQIRLCGTKAQYLENFLEVQNFKYSYPKSCNGDPFVYLGRVDSWEYNLKELPVDATPEYIASFIKGATAGDGTSGTEEYVDFLIKWGHLVGLTITSKHKFSDETNFGKRKQDVYRGTVRGISNYTFGGFVGVREESDLYCMVVPDHEAFTLECGLLTSNCAYAPAENYLFFSELMFLLLGGTGMGYSVQKRHVDKLPVVKGITHEGRYKYQIQDSIIGWADAVKVVVKAFFFGKPLPTFDYRDIREKGARLITTGGLAPGPKPLEECLNQLIKILKTVPAGAKLRPIQVHDMACIIADAVLAGGIRRAAMISLFDRDDQEMLKSKAGDWWNTHPYRGRANNSAVLVRGEVSEAEFSDLMKAVEASGCGEPGVYWTNNPDWGTNPCVEIALRPYQMCNLCELNVSNVTSQEELNARAKAGAFIGTLQAGYTDFHYLNHQWKLSCEADALLGVSMTGIASGTVTKLDMKEAANAVKEENHRVANLLGINPAARTTCVKPAGTTSLVLGTSSGIHAWHSDYYIRRMRAGKDEALAQYMQRVAPQLVEQDVNVAHQVVLSFPQKAPEGACVRTESMLSLLERVKQVSKEWVRVGHVYGENVHNVSCTISVKEDEWVELTNWMWQNREYYNGISVLPFFGAEAYPQLPFEDCSHATYESMLPYLEAIHISEVQEDNGDAIDLAGELACAGGSCEVK